MVIHKQIMTSNGAIHGTLLEATKWHSVKQLHGEAWITKKLH